jgi:hypothetical protein
MADTALNWRGRARQWIRSRDSLAAKQASADSSLQAARTIPAAREMVDTGLVILEISNDLIFTAQKYF